MIWKNVFLIYRRRIFGYNRRKIFVTIKEIFFSYNRTKVFSYNKRIIDSEKEEKELKKVSDVFYNQLG
jgi:hypothetical protein